MNEITCLLGHERVMQVMRNCSPTRLVVEGGGGGGKKEQRRRRLAGWGVLLARGAMGTSSVLIMERPT